MSYKKAAFNICPKNRGTYSLPVGKAIPGYLWRFHRGREGKRLLNARCSDCSNLKPDNWCAALKRTVPGTRHLRKCDFYIQGKPNPLPVRPGKPQHKGLVRCVSCEHLSGWGLCHAGVGGGELAPRIWRWCNDFQATEPTGSCSECRYLLKQVCMVSGFKVTRPKTPIYCTKFNRR